jgi:hypothetical protein
MQIKKQRNGLVGKKLSYKWNANIGEFTYITTTDGSRTERSKSETPRKREKKEESKEDLF